MCGGRWKRILKEVWIYVMIYDFDLDMVSGMVMDL